MGFYKNSADPLEQKITLSEAIIEYDKSLKARAQKALDEFFNTQEERDLFFDNICNDLMY